MVISDAYDGDNGSYTATRAVFDNEADAIKNRDALRAEAGTGSYATHYEVEEIELNVPHT